jgi:hypothetical protein
MPFYGCAPQRSAVRGKETAQIASMTAGQSANS